MRLRYALKHFFFPHAGNNHRARALHLDVMLIYLLAFALLNIGLRSASQKFPDILGYATNIQVQQLLDFTNQKRLEAGLAPLSLNQQLSKAAAGKAADMFAKNYWAHISPDGKTPWDFITTSGYKYTIAGENLAKNFQDSAGVVNAWMASPSHRDNILKSGYKEVGFAVVNGKLQGEETTLVVQMFGARATPRTISEVPETPAQEILVPAGALTDASTAEELPVIVPEVAASVTQIPFASVISLPQFDIVRLRRDIAMIFGGMLVGVLLLDLWIAVRKRTVRAVGSTVAHVFFFIAILFSSNIVLHGSIL